MPEFAVEGVGPTPQSGATATATPAPLMRLPARLAGRLRRRLWRMNGDASIRSAVDPDHTPLREMGRNPEVTDGRVPADPDRWPPAEGHHLRIAGRRPRSSPAFCWPGWAPCPTTVIEPVATPRPHRRMLAAAGIIERQSAGSRSGQAQTELDEVEVPADISSAFRRLFTVAATPSPAPSWW